MQSDNEDTEAMKLIKARHASYGHGRFPECMDETDLLLYSQHLGELANLLKIHGPEKCHICGHSKMGAGEVYCSYPHGMTPDKEVSLGMWTWKQP